MDYNNFIIPKSALSATTNKNTVLVCKIALSIKWLESESGHQHYPLPKYYISKNCTVNHMTHDNFFKAHYFLWWPRALKQKKVRKKETHWLWLSAFICILNIYSVFIAYICLNYEYLQRFFSICLHCEYLQLFSKCVCIVNVCGAFCCICLHCVHHRNVLFLKQQSQTTWRQLLT